MNAIRKMPRQYAMPKVLDLPASLIFSRMVVLDISPLMREAFWIQNLDSAQLAEEVR